MIGRISVEKLTWYSGKVASCLQEKKKRKGSVIPAMRKAFFIWGNIFSVYKDNDEFRINAAA
jgi:hypothetical protein